MIRLIFGIFKVLKLPVKLLKSLFRKRRKISEKEKKLRSYVRNFSVGRLKNRSWQKYDKKGKQKKKKTNNWANEKKWSRHSKKT